MQNIEDCTALPVQVYLTYANLIIHGVLPLFLLVLVNCKVYSRWGPPAPPHLTPLYLDIVSTDICRHNLCTP